MTSSSNSNERQVSNVLARGERRLSEADVPSGDALLLLEHATSLSREAILSHPDELLTDEQVQSFSTYINERIDGYSVAALIGNKDFFGRSFIVSPDVLIPRPDTESIVEAAITIANGTNKPRILDLGTGSGCIAITLAVELPDAVVVASDISKPALAIAKKNCAMHHTAIKLIQSDLFEAIPAQRFDCIIANLPYLPEAHLSEKSIQKEPLIALYGGNSQGTAYYERVFNKAADFLSKRGSLIIEIDPSHVAELTKKAQGSLPEHTLSQITDLSGAVRGLIFSLV